jgi:hypothetical protein
VDTVLISANLLGMFFFKIVNGICAVWAGAPGLPWGRIVMVPLVNVLSPLSVSDAVSPYLFPDAGDAKSAGAESPNLCWGLNGPTKVVP